MPLLAACSGKPVTTVKRSSPVHWVRGALLPSLSSRIVARGAARYISFAVRLSHKIGKLGRSESYKRTWRRVQRKIHPIPLSPLLSRLDPERTREIQERYASSPIQIAKYADIEHYMKLNIERAQDLG